MKRIIIPIRRVPKRLDRLVYQVPPELADRLCEGQLVRIPFRSKNIFGLVSTESTDEKKEIAGIETIADLLHEQPFLHAVQCQLLEHLADFYHVSRSVIAAMMLPPLQKRKIAATPMPPPSSDFSQSYSKKPAEFFLYASENERRIFFEKTFCSTDTSLILVPEEYRMERYDPSSFVHAAPVLFWHSALSVKEQHDAWYRVRSGEPVTIIGTRGSVFLPFQKLDRIMIDYEHDANHKHWDQFPRFSVHDVAEILAAAYHAELIRAGFVPSIERYFFVHKDKERAVKPLSSLPPLPVRIANMANERRGGNFSPLSHVAEECIRHETGDVALYLNRLGFARSLFCRQCGFRPLCPSCRVPFVYFARDQRLACHPCRTSIAAFFACPSCPNSTLHHVGIGLEQLEDHVKRCLPETGTTEIVRIDRDTDRIPPAEQGHRRILVGTDRLFRFIDWKKTTSIIFVDIDRDLALPEYGAATAVWYRIAEACFFKTASASVLLQTVNPGHLLVRSLSEPERWYRTELNHRRELGYPPYCFFVRYLFSHPDPMIARQEALRLFANLQSWLTETKKNCTLLEPMPAVPAFARGRYTWILVARFFDSSYRDDVFALNSRIPDSWNVDPRPLSLVSP